MDTRLAFTFFATNTQQNSEKINISHLIVIGDSLTDRGIFYAGERMGTRLARRYFSDSPKGRFTNGWNWVDYLATSLINQFSIKSLIEQKQRRNKYDYLDLATKKSRPKKHIHDSEDLLQAIIKKDQQIKKVIGSYHLKDSRQIPYHDEPFVRCYSEGGLCNHNYSKQLFSKYISERLVVPYLSEKISAIKADDQKKLHNKKETLSIIWSGTNDFGLVNDPTVVSKEKKRVQLSIESLRQNIKALIDAGYCHFLLCNAPDATLAPRSNRLPKEKLMPLKNCIEVFNLNLSKLLGQFKETYPSCSFVLYDAHAEFQKIFENPDAHGLDKSKIDKCHVDSCDSSDPQSSQGYSFWDGLHPTSRIHYVIAHHMEEIIRSKYQIIPPAKCKPIKSQTVNKI
jgi:phospholipase/lecithinase/hemolysin